MDERTRRVGRNEALFRSVNEQIEALERPIAAIADRTFHIVCECGDLECTERIVVPVTEYEDVRADGALFFVLPGHEIPSAEDVVAVADTGAYYVVRKHDGGPQALAEATDPRA